MKFLNYSLSLSLSRCARVNNIKKFHKTSKIKNRKIMFVKSYLSSGVCVGGASFFSERSTSVSEGGLSEEIKNREGFGLCGMTNIAHKPT